MDTNVSLNESSPITSVGNYFVSNYPPFSQWEPQQIERFVDRMHQPSATQGPLGLYVHVPFCRHRCTYCYFRTHVKEAATAMKPYLDAVLAEADQYLELPLVRGRQLSNVYFGGGTPSMLKTDQIARLIGGLRQRFDWTNQSIEVTFECQPATLSLEKMQLLFELGVNRASLGVQTFDDELLRQLGRMASRADCIHAVELARQVGFDQVNLDLIAGLPGDIEAGWLDTIEQAIRLQPDSLTIYQLELTHNSILRRQADGGRLNPLPSWPEKRRWVKMAFDRLREAGYSILNGYWAVRNPQRQRFAYVTEHFWKGQDLLALGESAFGYFADFHYQNTDDLHRYLESVAMNQLPVSRAYQMSPLEKFHREVILQLKTGRLSQDYFDQKFGINPRCYFSEILQSLRQQGFLQDLDGDIQVTEAGLLQIDSLLENFYLPQHRGVRYT